MSALAALAEDGGFDDVVSLQTDVASFSDRELASLLEFGLPALERLVIGAYPSRHEMSLGYIGDVVDVLLDSKRSRPSVEVRAGSMWVVADGESPPELAHDDPVAWFDPLYRNLRRIDRPDRLVGSGADSSMYLIDWVVAQPELTIADLTNTAYLRLGLHERCVDYVSRRRPDVQLLLPDHDAQ